MKKSILLFFTFLLTLLGGGNVVYADAYKTLTFPDGNQTKVSSYTDTWTAIIDGDTWTITNFNNNNNGWTYIKCGRKSYDSVASIATAFPIDQPISSVVVTIDKIGTASAVNSIQLEISTDADFSDIVETVGASTIAAGDLTFKVSSPAANYYYKLVFDNAKKTNGNVQISQVVYNTDGTVTPTTCSTPTFSPADGTKFYDTVTVTATSSTEGATVQYSLTEDGTYTNLPEAGLVLGEDMKAGESVTVYAKAIDATGTLEESTVVSATYTKAEVLDGIAALRAQIEEDAPTTSTVYFVQLSNAVVTKVSGNVASIEEDGTGIYFYGSNSFSAGDVFSGLATVTGQLYNNYAELTSISGQTTTSGTAPEPTVVTTAQLNNDFATYGLRYVKIVGADVTTEMSSSNRNAVVTQDGTTLTVRGQSSSYTMQADTKANVEGICVLYSRSPQLMVYSQDDIYCYVPVSIGETGYATLYYGELNLIVPTGVSAWTYSVSGETLAANNDYPEEAIIPAGTAVVLRTLTEGDYNFEVTSSEGTAANANALRGTDEQTTITADNDNVLYMLSYGSKGIGFYLVSEDGTSFSNKAHKAYLQLPASTEAKFFSLEGGATGINSVATSSERKATIYTLQGQRVQGMPAPGLYIVNGKKTVVR